MTLGYNAQTRINEINLEFKVLMRIGRILCVFCTQKCYCRRYTKKNLYHFVLFSFNNRKKRFHFVEVLFSRPERMHVGQMIAQKKMCDVNR